MNVNGELYRCLFERVSHCVRVCVFFLLTDCVYMK